MHQVISIISCIIGFVIFSVAMVPVLLIVHCTMDRICARHARRFCRRHGLEVNRVRWQIEFEQRSDGKRALKTECTLVQLDCFDSLKQRRLVLLRVWPLGVRKMLSDQKYPETYDEQWPQNTA
jgi:hypothetical protein